MSINITLAWTELACLERNGAITSYAIKYGEGMYRNITINIPAMFTTHLITGLKPFTQYTFSAVNSVGSGSFSSPSDSIQTAEDGK